MAAIEVVQLSKTYGQVRAVDGISFSVEPTEVFGLVGPNGAGKTTTLEIIEGLRSPDGGTVLVGGLDMSRHAREAQERIGVQLQSTTLLDDLTVLETVGLFSSLFQRRVDTDSLIKEMALEDKKSSRVKNLSGGQKQRLAVALALVNDPEIVFLDEPTTGLDPQARRNLWDTIDAVRRRGKTVVLTTHYMEEAEVLCDRVGIMDQGRLIALDTPRELVRSLDSGSMLELEAEGVDASELQRVDGVTRVQQEGNEYLLYTQDVQRALTSVLSLSESSGFAIKDLRVRSATLEDVFIALTGRRLRE